jgi:NADPH-dependent curcumin reductase CurA
MMNTWSSREWQLACRPTGTPTAADVELVETTVGPAGRGQVVVRNRALSVETYMWGRMTGESDYTTPFELNAPMTGHAIGEVVESADATVPVGATVLHEAGWREYAALAARDVRAVDLDGVPASAWLGVLGLTGFTAWAGLTRVASCAPGETVFVSAAAGGVGSTVVQLAKAMGCTVIASAGSDAKLAYIKDELGADAVFSHRRESIRDALAEALDEAGQDGVDVYFDNVGGEQLEGAIRRMRAHGRIALCGAVSTYGKRVPGPRNLLLAIWRELRLEGFLVSSHEPARAQFEREITAALRAGTLRPVETLRAGGVEVAFDAFLAMLAGADLGKTIVQLA